MSDVADRGITVTEMAPMDQPIDVSRETAAAFVGRSLRGPLNQPVLVHGFGEFRRRFGDTWSRSSLGPAVQQFFEHGGRNLYIVRVANNARGAMICLPASGSALVLRAIEPGSTECIRAAVDFDGVEPDNDELFNLTLQRIDPVSGIVIDQEIFQYADYRDGSYSFIADLMLTSSIARVENPLPTHRPEATIGLHVHFESPYVGHAQDGTDGQELTDYDLIGSRKTDTGLFALQHIDQFDLLYLPPPGKGRDLGPMSILAAERYCQQRGAMLIVDPAADWLTPADAIRGIRELGYASPNMIGYFPRMRHRHDVDVPARVVGGVIAGLLCKLDRGPGVWHDLQARGLAVSRSLVPAVDVDQQSTEILARKGFNIISKGSSGSVHVLGSVTMGRGSESHRDFVSLPVRRLCLQILNAIDQATRWAVFEPDDAHLAARIYSQVTAYLSFLVDMGALDNDRYDVQCDAGMFRRDDGLEHGVTTLIVFHPVGCKESVSFTLHQRVGGCRVASTAFAPVFQDCA